MGNTMKIDNLAIFKATVEANGLDTLYDAEQDKEGVSKWHALFRFIVFPKKLK